MLNSILKSLGKSEKCFIIIIIIMWCGKGKSQRINNLDKTVCGLALIPSSSPYVFKSEK